VRQKNEKRFFLLDGAKIFFPSFEKRPGMCIFELYLNCSGIVFYTINIFKIFKNKDRESISNVKKVLHQPSESKNGKAAIDLYILVSVEVGK
jgi:hypothetical protein